MTNEIARREIESLDYYLQNHTDDYSEESHSAMMMAIKALEQEPVLDKIRAEIEARLCDVVSDYADGYRTAIQGVLIILDKYKAESEEQKCTK